MAIFTKETAREFAARIGTGAADESPEPETPVIFRAERSGKFKGDVTAVFPCDPADAHGHSMSCFAHIGQHSGCSFEWYYTTRAATPAEYAGLKRELESAPYGYRLKVYSRMQPWMREAAREAVRKMAAGPAARDGKAVQS